MMHKRHGLTGSGLSFLAGCAAGGIWGLLYAQQSGMTTRCRLIDLAVDVKKKAGELKEHTTMAVQRMVERGIRSVNA